MPGIHNQTVRAGRALAANEAAACTVNLKLRATIDNGTDGVPLMDRHWRFTPPAT